MELLDFLKDEGNHSMVEKYHHQWYIKETALCKDAKSKIIFLFINALNASNSRGKLDNMGDSIRTLREDIDSIVGDRISFSLFTEAFINKMYQSVSEEAIGVLFKKLLNYKQLGHKKAALFLRDVLYTAGADIFKDVVPSTVLPLLIVPVDKVISDILQNYFDVTKTNEEWSAYLAKEYREDSMYFEDLWFWGHFGTRTSKGERIVEKDGNEPMFAMDTVIATMPKPNEYISDVKERIKTFAKIIDKNKATT